MLPNTRYTATRVSMAYIIIHATCELVHVYTRSCTGFVERDAGVLRYYQPVKRGVCLTSQIFTTTCGSFSHDLSKLIRFRCRNILEQKLFRVALRNCQGMIHHRLGLKRPVSTSFVHSESTTYHV